jgi:hypothetical protein
MPSPHGPSAGLDGAGSEPEHELERQPDDRDLEVSDLPRPAQRWLGRLVGSPPEDAVLAPWYRQRMQAPRPLAAAVLVVMLGLILLVATPIAAALLTLVPHPIPTPATLRLVFPTPVPATPTPSPYPTPTLIAPAIGPIPATCPQGSPLVDFDPAAIIPGVGGSDVWLVVGAFIGSHGSGSGQRAIAEIGSFRPSDYTRFGWPVQVMVLVKSDLTQTITLTGRDLRTGYSLWLSPEANTPGSIEEATPVATIDPIQPMASTSDGLWHIWFGVLYLPGAGCYTAQASWPAGGWTVTFAAGR